MSGFPVYVPYVNEKEASIEELMEKIRKNQALIAAYNRISGNSYMPLVPDNEAVSVLGTKICFLGHAAVIELEENMNIFEGYGTRVKK